MACGTDRKLGRPVLQEDGVRRARASLKRPATMAHGVARTRVADGISVCHQCRRHGLDHEGRRKGLGFGNRLGRRWRRHFSGRLADSVLAEAQRSDHVESQRGVSQEISERPGRLCEREFYLLRLRRPNGLQGKPYGGTSFAAPMWAGYLALANEQAATKAINHRGFINPTIYPLGLGTTYDTDFHDITVGSNGFPADKRLRFGFRLGQSKRGRPD